MKYRNRWLATNNQAGDQMQPEKCLAEAHGREAVGESLSWEMRSRVARSARFSSGLNVLDFMKRTSLVRCDPVSLAAIGPAAVSLAEAEGFDAHALSVAIRLRPQPG